MVGIGDESCVLSGFSADDYVSDVFVWYVRKGGALAMLCHVPSFSDCRACVLLYI